MADRYVIIERRDGKRPRVLIEADTLEEAEALLQSLRRLHHRVELTTVEALRATRPGSSD